MLDIRLCRSLGQSAEGLEKKKQKNILETTPTAWCNSVPLAKKPFF